MASLRTKLIRLAAANPALREDLLSILANSRSADDTMAKYEEGEDVPLSELPPEMQENVRNPPPEVLELREEMERGADEIMAKFEEGEDVDLEDLPPEMQRNVRNPPPEVRALREEMRNRKQGSRAANVRPGMYEFSDGITALRNAFNGPAMLANKKGQLVMVKNDRELLKLVKDLTQLSSKLFRHMNAKYIWD